MTKQIHLINNTIKSRLEALKIVVSLSVPSKMPCYGYALPVSACKTGQKIMKIENSTCNQCYANGGFYLARQDALNKRLGAIKKARWADAMVYLIHFHNQKYFRWHDSGDIQSIDHLDKIVDIARRTPDTIHWLPTREYELVKHYIKVLHREIPKNLVIRLSAFMIDGPAPVNLALSLGLNTSTVVTDGYHMCPASKQDNKCGSCRTCWDPDTLNVSYAFHAPHRGRPKGNQNKNWWCTSCKYRNPLKRITCLRGGDDR